jgi:glycosyltransferase involved in cell wall biosynthesis
VREEWGVGDGQVVIGFVGRLVAEKGLSELLEAFRRLRARHPDVALVLVGDVDHAKPDALRPAALEAVRTDGTFVVGWQDPIEPCYLGFDVLALPSHREGFPRAPMEAAAMGRAVVASDVRGCRQTVEDGVTGVLVPVRDAAALEAALEDLIDDGDLRSEYGRNARARASERFDVRYQVAITVAVYEDAARKRWR